MAGRAREIITAAVHALREDEEDNFEEIVDRTRQSFRPRRYTTIRRGRKSTSFFKRKTLLVRRANVDYCPIKAESDMLTSYGLGR